MKKQTPKVTKRMMMDVVALGRMGGLKRAANLTPEQRSAISLKAAKTRWSKAAKRKGKT